MTVDEFILEQENEDCRAVLMVLRDIIKRTLPDVEEVVKWRIPCYYYNGPVCYLHPKKDFVNFVFVRGIALPDPAGLLTGNQKQVRGVPIRFDEDIPGEELITLLQEASTLNATIMTNKGKKGSLKW